MDHPASIASPRPWRAAAIIAAGIATLELLAIVVLLVVVVGKPFAHRVAQEAKSATAAAAAPKASKHEGPKPKLARRETSVIVLNGNGVADAAGRMSAAVHRFHYIIAGTGNAPRSNFGRSIVMFRQGYKGEGLRLGHDLGIRRVTPLDGIRAADIAGAHLVLIVGGSKS